MVLLYAGIARYLTDMPVWVLFSILIFLAIIVLFPLRAITEGEAFNHSFSSMIGDWALISLISMGHTLIKEDPSIGYIVLESVSWQDGVLISSTVFAFAWQLIAMSKSNSWGTIADAYHNIFIVCMIIYFLVLTVPVILIAGSQLEIILMICAGAIWIITFIIDAQQGRLNQPEYREKLRRRWK